MLNHLTIQGNLVNDPTQKWFESGSFLSEFTIACNNKYKDKERDSLSRLQAMESVWPNFLRNDSAKAIRFYLKVNFKLNLGLLLMEAIAPRLFAMSIDGILCPHLDHNPSQELHKLLS